MYLIQKTFPINIQEECFKPSFSPPAHPINIFLNLNKSKWVHAHLPSEKVHTNKWDGFKVAYNVEFHDKI